MKGILGRESVKQHWGGVCECTKKGNRWPKKLKYLKAVKMGVRVPKRGYQGRRLKKRTWEVIVTKKGYQVRIAQGY